MKNKVIPNFSLVPFPDSCVNAYGKETMGAKAANADVMLTFGSTVAPMNGRNQQEETEYPIFIDVFLNKAQALSLLKNLQKVLDEK